jgi:molybdopterin synthase catalytic subunit
MFQSLVEFAPQETSSATAMNGQGAHATLQAGSLQSLLPNAPASEAQATSGSSTPTTARTFPSVSLHRLRKSVSADPTTVHSERNGIYVALTHHVLSPTDILDRVRSPAAGALVLFTGTTRDNFASRPVKQLSYSAYEPLALRSMQEIALQLREKYELIGISIVHRLGPVPVGEDSILIAVSSPHRKAAWDAGEECLELVKARVEVWKLEEFADEEGGVWRANRDGVMGTKVAETKNGSNGNGNGDGIGKGHRAAPSNGGLTPRAEEG